MKYSSEIHKITKLENHEDNEVTVEELVDQYYKDPDKYFEVNRSNSSAAPPSGVTTTAATATTAIAISKTSIELAKPLEIKNSKKDGVRDEYLFDTKNKAKSQQITGINVKSIQTAHEGSTKLFDQGESNNFLIFKCYYCNYQTRIEREYERHVIIKHPGKLAYASGIDLEKMGIKESEVAN